MSMEGFMGKFGTAKRSFTSYSSHDEKAEDNRHEESHQEKMEGFVQNFGNVTEEYEFHFKNPDETFKLRFDKNEHVYYRVAITDGVAKWVKIPGITNVLGVKDKSQVLMPWAVNEATDFVRASFLELTEFEIEVLQSDPLQLQEWLFTILETAKKAYKDRSKTATDIGHAAHDWLERYIKADIAGDLPQKLSLDEERSKMDERAISCCEAALQWMRAHSVRWIYTERKIYSRTYDVAGTLDGVCLVDSCDDPECCKSQFKDVLSLMDWKSSNALYDSYRWQGAIYEQAIEDELGLDIKHRWVVQLGKYDGAFNSWHIYEEDFVMDLRCFLACLELVRSSEDCAETLRERRRAEKAAARAAKEAAELKLKNAKAKRRHDTKTAKTRAKVLYKSLRAQGRSVVEANAINGEWLKHQLKDIDLVFEVETGVAPAVEDEEVREAA